MVVKQLGNCVTFMLRRGSVLRALDRLPILGCVQKHHASFRLCAWSPPQKFGVALKSSFSSSRQVPLFKFSQARMGWACAACTFVNDAGSACGVCSEPAPGAKWVCDVCTFVNIGETSFCEICDTGRSAPNEPSSAPSAPFRPLRAGASRVGADAPITIGDNHDEEECVVTGHKDEAAINPKSRKRKAKEAAVIDLSEAKSEEDVPDVKDGKRKKESGEESEPNHLLKNLHKERMARMKAGASEVKKKETSLEVKKEKSSSEVKKEKSSSEVKKEKSSLDAKKEKNSRDVEQEESCLEVKGSVSDPQKGKGVVSLSSLTREQKLAYIEAEGTWLEKPSDSVTVLSYNVWFREDLELQARLDAIGDVILQHRPHIVFFQEVTDNIYSHFQRASWWKSYNCSVKPGAAAQRAYFCMQLSKLPVVTFRQSPFRNSVMGRELCLAELDAGKGARLLVATSHLESPCPAPPTWNQMFSPERVAQAKEAVSLLQEFPNVVFGGDMNWDDQKDGPPPLPSGWFDAWLHLRPGQDGFTYDTKANLMLSGQRSLRKRLDRMFCRLRDFEAVSIEMVGTKAIPDLTYSKEKKVKGQVQVMKLPVLPSDHFGLLLKLCRKSA